MYDLAKVTKEFTDIVEQAGCKMTVPISFNNRLTRTLGRVISERNKYTNVTRNVRVEFSTNLIKTASDKSIRDVIEHEACHYIATHRSKIHHGHDDYFKAICDEIGCTNNKTSTSVDRLVADEAIYRYTIYCPSCGVIGGYNRMSKTLQNLQYCNCAKCGNKKLTYIQNW